ncbi:MAG: hypothetical protein LBV18_06535 [Alistipes sp.]|jgi:hypothetical protein|nr:hypothetical protein [Alistipes sp.]
MVKLLAKYMFPFSAAALIALSAGVSSCRKDFYDNSPDDALKVSQTTVTVAGEPGSVRISVTSRFDSWSIAGAEQWLRVTPASGGKGITRVELTFDDNTAENALTRTATLIVSADGQERTIEVEQRTGPIESPYEHADAGINAELYAELLEPWYYNSESWKDVRPDFNDSWNGFFERFLKGRKNNEPDGKRWVKVPEYLKDDDRYLYSRIERHPAAAPSNNVPLGFGMEFELAEGNRYNGTGAQDVVARILYVMPGSPAARAGLRRGDWFWSVEGEKMGSWEGKEYNGMHFDRIIDSLARPIEGVSQTLGMPSFRSYDKMFTDAGRTVTLTPERRSYNPIIYTNSNNVILLDNVRGEATRTGYMVCTAFDPDYRNEFVAEFARFADRPAGEELTHFILDLRYSKTGTAEMAELVGNLLVPDAAAGRVFARYAFNKGAADARSKTVNFTPHANSLRLDTVFILTSKHTAGAAELLINALSGLEGGGDEDDGIMKVVLVGQGTEGMSVGSVRREHVIGDWRYQAHIAAFRSFNAAGFGEYGGGFLPNGAKVDEWEGDNIKWPDTWGWRGGEQSTEDPLLKETMQYVEGLLDVPIQPVGVNTQNTKRGGLYSRFAEFGIMTTETE